MVKAISIQRGEIRDKSDNYRTVFILPVMLEAMERRIQDKLSNCLISSAVLSQN